MKLLKTTTFGILIISNQIYGSILASFIIYTSIRICSKSLHHGTLRLDLNSLIYILMYLQSEYLLAITPKPWANLCYKSENQCKRMTIIKTALEGHNQIGTRSLGSL